MAGCRAWRRANGGNGSCYFSSQAIEIGGFTEDFKGTFSAPNVNPSPRRIILDTRSPEKQ